MKRYYTSFIRYKLVMIFWPIVFTFNGVMTIIRAYDYEGFLYYTDMFLGWSMIVLSVFMLMHLYRLYKKLVYIEINKESIIYSFRRKEIIYEYSDAKFYTIRRTGKYRNLYIHSIKKGKKILVPLVNFDVIYDDFILLLSDYSGKEIYYKDYGEEPKLIK